MFCSEGALVLWLWEETHVLKVMGSNPSTCMEIFAFVCSKNCKVCLKRPKIKIEAGDLPFKK